MRSAQVLAAAAARLNRDAGAPAIPALYFFTDPQRTPDPCAIARRLPRGAAVVYRHFGAFDRARRARELRAICNARGLALLIGADPDLARASGADGVHWPERLLPAQHGDFRLVTGAAHGAAAAARCAAADLDACILSPVLETASTSANPALGLFRASQIARATLIPVIALGGIDSDAARRLPGRGFAGIAAVSGLIA
jgi:thiamine-phosphate pyrophosphorylase